jgi:hypothetical protein
MTLQFQCILPCTTKSTKMCRIYSGLLGTGSDFLHMTFINSLACPELENKQAMTCLQSGRWCSLGRFSIKDIFFLPYGRLLHPFNIMTKSQCECKSLSFFCNMSLLNIFILKEVFQNANGWTWVESLLRSWHWQIEQDDNTRHVTSGSE